MGVVHALHKWTVGRGAYVVLAEPDAVALRTHARAGVPVLFFTELWVPLRQRGKGRAHALIQAATDWADCTGVDLWLYVAPHGPTPRATQHALIALYEGYGFQYAKGEWDEYEMVRRYVPRSPD